MTAAQHAGAGLLVQEACTGLPSCWLMSHGVAGGVLPGWRGRLHKAGHGTAVHLSLTQPANRMSNTCTFEPIFFLLRQKEIISFFTRPVPLKVLPLFSQRNEGKKCNIDVQIGREQHWYAWHVLFS